MTALRQCAASQSRDTMVSGAMFTILWRLNVPYGRASVVPKDPFWNAGLFRLPCAFSRSKHCQKQCFRVQFCRKKYIIKGELYQDIQTFGYILDVRYHLYMMWITLIKEVFIPQTYVWNIFKQNIYLPFTRPPFWLWWEYEFVRMWHLFTNSCLINNTLKTVNIQQQ